MKSKRHWPKNFKYQTLAWSKKPKHANCDCGRPYYRLKHGEPICQRCDRIEGMLIALRKPTCGVEIQDWYEEAV